MPRNKRAGPLDGAAGIDRDHGCSPAHQTLDELSRTTLSVIDLLLNGNLLRLRSEEVADSVQISTTTLRRRLRADGIHYQSILDQVRRHRCALMLEKSCPPGKCVAWELGYAEVNSFYRAFRRRTGHNYSDLKQLYV